VCNRLLVGGVIEDRFGSIGPANLFFWGQM
jgi:hypothetical protein